MGGGGKGVGALATWTAREDQEQQCQGMTGMPHDQHRTLIFIMYIIFRGSIYYNKRVTINRRPLTPKACLHPMINTQNSKPRPTTANAERKGKTLKLKLYTISTFPSTHPGTELDSPSLVEGLSAVCRLGCPCHAWRCPSTCGEGSPWPRVALDGVQIAV